MSIIEAPSPTDTAPVTRREILHRAADLIEEWDWTQWNRGMPFHPDHPAVDNPEHEHKYCLLGAIAKAYYDYTGQRETYGTVLDGLIGVCDYKERDSLIQWNDAVGRTKAEVVARLRETAEEQA